MKYNYIIFILFSFFINIYSYSITFPTFINNKAIISNIDVKNICNNELLNIRRLFNKVPVIIFKNQKLNPSEYYNFIKLFDKNHDKSISLYNHLNNTIPTVPQVELINRKNLNKNKNVIKLDDYYNYLWHQDVTGSNKYITPIISSMYMLVTPTHGDDTIFASYEDAYDVMDMDLKKYIDKLTIIHSNSKKRQQNCLYDYTGLRTDYNYRYDDDIFTENPLVVYSDKTRCRKTLLLNPKKFLKFKELTNTDSYNLYRHIMKKYVIKNDNIITHHWDDYDLCIFNNRKLIHTSSPKASYHNKDRIYLQCRLGTNEPYLTLCD